MKNAFMDKELNDEHVQVDDLANSINVARLLPQALCVRMPMLQMKNQGGPIAWVGTVPSGNFGNITAGLFTALRLGLPVKRFVAANRHAIYSHQYHERQGEHCPAPVGGYHRLWCADVGDPVAPCPGTGFCHGKAVSDAIASEISAAKPIPRWSRYAETVQKVLWRNRLIRLDPHGACGYRALAEGTEEEGEVGLFLEAAPPLKIPANGGKHHWSVEKYTGKLGYS